MGNQESKNKRTRILSVCSDPRGPVFDGQMVLFSIDKKQGILIAGFRNRTYCCLELESTRNYRLMKNIQYLLVLFIIGLTIFFNIERLDFGQNNLINIASFVYVLGGSANILTFAVPILRRSKVFVSLLLWAIIYLLLKLLFWSFDLVGARPLLGGIYTYLSITEMVLLLITVGVAHKISAALLDFEDAVKRITFTDDNKRVRQLENASEDIGLEIFRSRHHHRPLSLIVVQPKPESIKVAIHRAVQETQQAMISNYVINSMAHTISKYLRRTDLILEQRGQGRFMVLSPETTASDSHLLADYIQTISEEQLGISVCCGIATFPDEALTFEELVQHAESHVGGNR